MSGGEILWLSLHWLHAVAAVGWVGSTLFYATVIGPGAKRQAAAGGPANEAAQSVVAEWREFLEIAAFVLLITGVLIAVNRLGQPRIGALYAANLGVKVALAVLMGLIALRRLAAVKKGALSPAGLVAPSWAMSGLGAVVVLIAIILRTIYEKSLVP